MDPKANWYPSHSPYNYTLNNPLNRIDPNGEWTIKVVVRNDRSATLTLYDNKGKNRGSYTALAKGSSRNRMNENADTPHGRYKMTGWIKPGKNQSAKKKKSFGPNPRLKLKGEAGEAKDSKRTLLRVHGGDKSSDGNLRSTWGCVRLSNEDMKDLYDTTQTLESNDDSESPETLEVITSADDARREEAKRTTTYKTHEGMEEMY